MVTHDEKIVERTHLTVRLLDDKIQAEINK
jgi:ABC-type lipoprotein export system ATPase subunit